MTKAMTNAMLKDFRTLLAQEEKAAGTIEKYCRDVQGFLAFAGGKELTKELTLEYKEKLMGKYAPVTVGSMLAALNVFLKKLGFHDCAVRMPGLDRNPRGNGNS